MNQILIDVSKDDVTGVNRKLLFTGLTINPDLNMILTGEVVCYHVDGRTMAQAIEEDNALTNGQKVNQLQRYKSIRVKADTTGIWVDESGNPVPLVEVKDENGNTIDWQQPPNTVSEIAFWQNLPVSHFLQGAGLPNEIMEVLSQIKFSSLFYGAVEQTMALMDERKRF